MAKEEDSCPWQVERNPTFSAMWESAAVGPGNGKRLLDRHAFDAYLWGFFLISGAVS